MAAVKMGMNSHKGAIEDIAPGHLIRALVEEMDELESALCDENLMHVIEEAADIMNFLVATVHQQIHTYRSRK